MAKASLSQRSSHQTMVTRLPNHWCESSCVITSATRFWMLSGAVFGFPIAPASKSGTPTWSTFP